MGWSITVYDKDKNEITGGHWSYSGLSDYIDSLPEALQDLWFTQRTADPEVYIYSITTEQAKILHEQFKDFKTDDWHHENLLYLLSETIKHNGCMRWT